MKGTIFLFDEEHRRCHRRLQRTDPTGLEVLFEKSIQFGLFLRRQRIDLRRTRLRTWDKFDRVIPFFERREGVKGFTGEDILEVMELLRNDISEALRCRFSRVLRMSLSKTLRNSLSRTDLIPITGASIRDTANRRSPSSKSNSSSMSIKAGTSGS